MPVSRKRKNHAHKVKVRNQILKEKYNAFLKKNKEMLETMYEKIKSSSEQKTEEKEIENIETNLSKKEE